MDFAQAYSEKVFDPILKSLTINPVGVPNPTMEFGPFSVYSRTGLYLN